MNFKDFWNSVDLDKYRTTEDYCAATWEACKKEVLKEVLQILENHVSYTDVGYGRQKVIKVNPLNIIDKIEKL